MNSLRWEMSRRRGSRVRETRRWRHLLRVRQQCPCCPPRLETQGFASHTFAERRRSVINSRGDPQRSKGRGLCPQRAKKRNLFTTRRAARLSSGRQVDVNIHGLPGLWAGELGSQLWRLRNSGLKPRVPNGQILISSHILAIAKPLG
jgi:hypothetical protein